MKLSDFDYHLPPELIAHTPPKERGQSRLMVIDRTTRDIQHRQFCDFAEYFGSNDVLVMNQSKVIKARLPLDGGKEIFLAKKVQSPPPSLPPVGGGSYAQNELSAELFAERKLPPSFGRGLGGGRQENKKHLWQCLVRKGKHFQIGDVHELSDGSTAEVLEILENGQRIIQFTPQTTFLEMIDVCGHVPLPPYIKREDDLDDISRYQTVYADDSQAASVAAPTAGLHFSEAMLDQLRAKGVQIEYVTLHVGLGTFAPVKVNDITDHEMHTEWCEVAPDVAERINTARAAGKKITAIGTTSLRTLESFAGLDGNVTAGHMETGIFIYPPYRFKVIDQLLTNFHLPKSTLLMLMSAFAGDGMSRDRPVCLSEGGHADTAPTSETSIAFVKDIYAQAIEQKYRFFSYGDATLWL